MCNKIILLVEDEVIVAMSEKKTLEKYNYNVIIAKSGEEAISIIKNNSHIDLILMDINLGKGINGAQAAKIILENNNIPLVFLSSHTEPEVVEKTEKITSYGYIVKNSGETVLNASIKMAFKLHDSLMVIKNSEAKYKFLVENIKDVIWILDPYNLRFLYVSPSIKQLRGYTPEEIMAEPMDKALTPEAAAYVREIINKRILLLKSSNSLLPTETFYTEKIEQLCKDGSTVLTEVITKYYFNEKTGRIEIYGVSRDLTGRDHS